MRTPIGELALAASERGLARIEFGAGEETAAGREATRHLKEAKAALARYFAGDARALDEIALDFGDITAFRRRIYEALRAIPFGETRSYSELAAAAGRPRAYRAVGTAMAENPLPLVLPCHRVIGAGGDLCGFGPGLAVKRRLLAHEGVIAAR